MKKILALPLIAMLAACAPREQEPALPLPEVLPRITSEALITSDGAELPLKHWLPKGKPKAVLLALHGFNDYSNAFAMPGEYMAKKGIAVYAYDQRGFGRAPERGIWGGEGNLTADARQGLDALKKKYPKTSLYLLGESMGGAVAISLMSADDAPQIDGVILSAPAIWGGAHFNPLYRSVLWGYAHIAPWYRLTGDGLKIRASDNIDMLIALGRDPLVIKGTRVDAVYGLSGLMDNAYRKAVEVDAPTLLLYGQNDEIIPTEPVDDIVSHINDNVTYVRYPEGFHMLLRDLQREVVWKDVVEWIYKRRIPSGLAARRSED